MKPLCQCVEGTGLEDGSRHGDLVLLPSFALKGLPLAALVQWVLRSTALFTKAV